MKFVLALGVLLIGQTASAATFAECLALRDLGQQLVSKARRVESTLVNEKCPKERFRKKLNNVSDWAWVTDVEARQKCRDEWRAENQYIYRDLFGNGYRSDKGIEIAKNIEELGVQMETISCPTGDLKWTK